MVTSSLSRTEDKCDYANHSLTSTYVTQKCQKNEQLIIKYTLIIIRSVIMKPTHDQYLFYSKALANIHRNACVTAISLAT